MVTSGVSNRSTLSKSLVLVSKRFIQTCSLDNHGKPTETWSSIQIKENYRTIGTSDSLFSLTYLIYRTKDTLRLARQTIFQPQPYCVERRVHIWVNSPSIHYCRGFACFYLQFILNYHRLDIFVRCSGYFLKLPLHK